MVGDAFNRGIADRQNTPMRTTATQCLECVSIRSIEQKRRCKAHRKPIELMMVVVSYKDWKVVGFGWRQINCLRTSVYY